MNRLAISVCIILCYLAQTEGLNNVTGFYTWEDGNRAPLYCPDHCQTDNKPPRCCSCEARRCWDITPDVCPIGSLQLEYIDIYGNGKVIDSCNETYAKLDHTNGRLKFVPENICHFSDRLVILDLRGNRLTNVSSLRCLHELDTLLLDDNLITDLNNNTFTNMTNLRVLSFRNNLIKSLSPNVISLSDGNILSADFSGNNHLEQVDITNIVHAGPFCVVNFSSSPLEFLPNERDYNITHTLHGPGDMLLESTNIGSLMNFSTLGVTDYGDLGNYFSCKFSIDESSIACDASMYRFLSGLPNEATTYWPNIDNQEFYCQSPDSMKGKDVVQAYNDGDFDDMTVDISENPDCPSYYCQCIEQPSQDRILVNCTDVGFTSMPDRMPVGAWGLNRIYLILDKNKIQSLDNRDYLERLVHLNLSQNKITHFHTHAVTRLNSSATINLENQQMANLPVTLKDKDPKLFTFGDHPVICDCSNVWIGDWIRYKDGRGRLNCLVDGNQIAAAESVDASSLSCNEYNILPFVAIVVPIVALVGLLILAIGLCYTFRYDIMLRKRRWSKNRKSEPITPETYDVFISVNEDNQEAMKIVARFIADLEQLGYSVFLPYTYIVSGIRDHEMMKSVDMSRNYVVVLCQDYLKNYNTKSEFDTIWTSFSTNVSKQIVVIDFDYLDSGSVPNARLKALRRSPYGLNFNNRESKLISRLIDLIGHPARKEQSTCTEDRNATKNVFGKWAKTNSTPNNCKFRVCNPSPSANAPRAHNNFL